MAPRQSAVIVAVTAHAFAPEQEAARAAGCDVVIAKPIDLTALADALEAVASDGLAAFGAKAGALTMRSQPVTLTSNRRTFTEPLVTARDNSVIRRRAVAGRRRRASR